MLPTAQASVSSAPTARAAAARALGQIYQESFSPFPIGCLAGFASFTSARSPGAAGLRQADPGRLAGDSNYDLANKTVDTGSPNDAPKPTVRTINSRCNDIPAELDGVVTVASLQRVGTTLDSVRSSFSNYGLGKIDVAAPGSSIYSTTWNTRTGVDGYGTKSGTSMASPHVAGVMAQMKSAHPSWSPAQMINELKARAVPKPCPLNTPACVGTDGDNSFFGAGVVDTLAVIQ